MRERRRRSFPLLFAEAAGRGKPRLYIKFDFRNGRTSRISAAIRADTSENEQVKSLAKASHLTRAIAGILSLLVLASAVASSQADDPAEISQRAKQLMAAGQFAEAVPLYEKLVRAIPQNPGLITNLGMALHMSG